MAPHCQREVNVPTQGFGNYSDDKAKDIALGDTRDAFKFLKKPSVSRGNHKVYCHTGVYGGNGAAFGETSRVLKHLSILRPDYNVQKKRILSATEKYCGGMSENILKIYETSHQNHRASKITQFMNKNSEKIAEKTVANYIWEYAPNG